MKTNRQYHSSFLVIKATVVEGSLCGRVGVVPSLAIASTKI